MLKKIYNFFCGPRYCPDCHTKLERITNGGMDCNEVFDKCPRCHWGSQAYQGRISQRAKPLKSVLEG
jgi:hypothetical protein